MLDLESKISGNSSSDSLTKCDVMQMTKVNQYAKNPDVVRHVGDRRASSARLLSNMSAISGCMTSLHEESSDHWPQKEGGNWGERSVSIQLVFANHQ